MLKSINVTLWAAQAFVLSPTQELATQIQSIFQSGIVMTLNNLTRSPRLSTVKIQEFQMSLSLSQEF